MSKSIPAIEEFRRHAVEVAGGLPQAAGLCTTALAILAYQADLPIEEVVSTVRSAYEALARLGIPKAS